MATVDLNPLRFLIAGIVSAWDPLTRLLNIGGHRLWVPPEVALATVAIGTTITAAGHQEPSGRCVVTRFTVA